MPETYDQKSDADERIANYNYEDALQRAIDEGTYDPNPTKSSDPIQEYNYEDALQRAIDEGTYDPNPTRQDEDEDEDLDTEVDNWCKEQLVTEGYRQEDVNKYYESDDSDDEEDDRPEQVTQARTTTETSTSENLVTRAYNYVCSFWGTPTTTTVPAEQATPDQSAKGKDEVKPVQHVDSSDQELSKKSTEKDSGTPVQQVDSADPKLSKRAMEEVSSKPTTDCEEQVTVPQLGSVKGAPLEADKPYQRTSTFSERLPNMPCFFTTKGQEVLLATGVFYPTVKQPGTFNDPLREELDKVAQTCTGSPVPGVNNVLDDAKIPLTPREFVGFKSQLILERDGALPNSVESMAHEKYIIDALSEEKMRIEDELVKAQKLGIISPDQEQLYVQQIANHQAGINMHRRLLAAKGATCPDSKFAGDDDGVQLVIAVDLAYEELKARLDTEARGIKVQQHEPEELGLGEDFSKHVAIQ